MHTCEYCKKPIKAYTEMGTIKGAGCIIMAETSPAIDREIALHVDTCLPSWLLRHKVWVKFLRIIDYYNDDT